MKRIAITVLIYHLLCSCSQSGHQNHSDKVDISYDSIHKIILAGHKENFRLHTSDSFLPLKDSSKINRPLMKQLDSIFKIDQGPRNYYNDSIIVTVVTEIIDKNGWLGVDIVGYLGNATLFLVIQHADL